MRKRWKLRDWIGAGFILWALFAMAWLTNSLRTQGVDEATLRSNGDVSVQNDAAVLTFLPAPVVGHTALVFFCGSGIAAEAYAPLLRPVAEEGFPVFVVKLLYRFALRQLLDGTAAIGREEQEALTRSAILQVLADIEGHSCCLQRTLAARSIAEPEYKGRERSLAADDSHSFADRSPANPYRRFDPAVQLRASMMSAHPALVLGALGRIDIQLLNLPDVEREEVFTAAKPLRAESYAMGADRGLASGQGQRSGAHGGG